MSEIRPRGTETSDTSLYGYMLQTQRFLADTNQTYVNPEDLTDYINRARREVAMRTQSVRVLTPVSGEITHIDIKRRGRRFRNPRVLITRPDRPSGEQPFPGGKQARATASTIDGFLSNIHIEDGGAGYFQPRVQVVERHEGDNKPDDDEWWRIESPVNLLDEDEPFLVAHTVPLLTTHQFQEVYKFKDIPLEKFEGVAKVFAVKGVSFIYANYRYSIPVFPMSVYQAYVRIYPQQYLYIPTAGAQYGQGVNGSLYLYPIPDHIYNMEWDCFCLPKDLLDDHDYEAIPPPWTDAVSYFAAHLAYLGLQNLNAAQYYMNLYDDMVHRYSAYARPGRSINPYGRWAAFT